MQNITRNSVGDSDVQFGPCHHHSDGRVLVGHICAQRTVQQYTLLHALH